MASVGSRQRTCGKWGVQRNDFLQVWGLDKQFVTSEGLEQQLKKQLVTSGVGLEKHFVASGVSREATLDSRLWQVYILCDVIRHVIRHMSYVICHMSYLFQMLLSSRFFVHVTVSCILEYFHG